MSAVGFVELGGQAVTVGSDFTIDLILGHELPGTMTDGKNVHDLFADNVQNTKWTVEQLPNGGVNVLVLGCEWVGVWETFE